MSGADGVFVIGDLASIMSDGKPVPGLSPAAMQEGRHAAKNIVRLIRGEPTLPFHYRDKGTLATIGKAAAVGDIGRLHVSGLVAWLMWLFVHILFLIGFRNRFIVMVEWAWMYLRNDRGARLITGDVEPLLERGGKVRESRADAVEVICEQKLTTRPIPDADQHESRNYGNPGLASAGRPGWSRHDCAISVSARRALRPRRKATCPLA